MQLRYYALHLAIHKWDGEDSVVQNPEAVRPEGVRVGS